MLAALFLCAAGCKTITGDPVVVRAEQAQKVLVYTLDTLLKFEYDNRAYLWSINPQLKKFCDTCRDSEVMWIHGIDNATEAYKSNKSTENKATLVTWLAVIEQVVSDAQQALIEAKKVVTK